MAAAPPAYGPFTRWPEQTRRREHFAGMTRRRGVGSGPTCLWPFHTLARDAEYQPVAAGRVPLPDGQEAVAKRQGFRQVRWAAVSLAPVNIGTETLSASCSSPSSAAGPQQCRQARPARATMPASAASAEQPAKMMTLAEIQAHAAAHVHLAHKAANVPAGGKKLHKIDAAALADRANDSAFAGISR